LNTTSGQVDGPLLVAPNCPPPTVLTLIRHGEPESRYQDCYYGQMDVALSERGGEQSRALAERLREVPFDAIVSSDLERAWYLAELLAQSREQPVRRLAVFRERHMGRLQGIPVGVLQRDHAEVYNRWMADRIAYRCPEAENFFDLRERILPAIEQLVGAFAGRRVALVCHAGPIRIAVGQALGLPMENIFRIGIDHCSIHVIEYPAAGTPRVTLLNG
jgi:broad specificity phosphatase PhoE